MTKIKSAAIVRKLIKLSGEYREVFNDKTKVGRSIKVWGWKLEDYNRALAEMHNAGITAELVTTASRECFYGEAGENLRIRTVEMA